MKRLTIFLFLLFSFMLISAEASGPKLRVAISKFENKTNSYGNWEIGTGLSDMLITALVQSGRFTVVEREQLDKILGEQKLSLSGAITPQSSAKIGNMLGVQYLISGSVTEFINKSSSQGSKIRFKGISVGGKSFYAKLGIDIKVYDVNTGEIVTAGHADGEAKGTGFSLGAYRGPIDFSNSKMQKSPMGKAARQAIVKVVSYITEKIGSKEWAGKVITVKNGMVYINGGKNYGINEGDEFTIEKKGEELVDPDTGLSLGAETERIGTIKVVEVKGKYSICEVVSGSGFDKAQLVKVKK
ncbi:hypothetical protein J7L48_03820 [bacterium]|nr:hypothetical protein [bacterium]